MLAYAERLSGGMNLVRTSAALVVQVSQRYWRWITRYFDPISAAYGTAMGGVSLLFLLYCIVA